MSRARPSRRSWCATVLVVLAACGGGGDEASVTPDAALDAARGSTSAEHATDATVGPAGTDTGAAARPVRGGARSARPDVLLISLDTLRADAL